MSNDNNDEQIANQLADLAAIWMKEATEKMAKEDFEEALARRISSNYSKPAEEMPAK